jgi:hypothetical protein
MINNAKKLAKKQGNKLADAAPIVNKLTNTMANSDKVNCSVCLKSRVGLERCLCTLCAVCRHRPNESLCHCAKCGLPTCQNPGCTFYSYQVGTDPGRLCPRCLLPAQFGGTMPVNPYSPSVPNQQPSPVTSEKVKEVLSREFASQSMHHYLVRKGHYHSPQFIAAAVERGASHLARVYNCDPPAPHLAVILDILWYVSSQAYRKQPFLRGSFQLEDPGYRLFDFLRSYSKTYPRRWRSGKGGFGSSHLVDYIDYYSQVNARIYGGGDIPEYDQYGIDFKVCPMISLFLLSFFCLFACCNLKCRETGISFRRTRATWSLARSRPRLRSLSRTAQTPIATSLSKWRVTARSKGATLSRIIFNMRQEYLVCCLLVLVLLCLFLVWFLVLRRLMRRI